MQRRRRQSSIKSEDVLRDKLHDLQEEVGLLKTRLEDVRKAKSISSEIQYSALNADQSNTNPPNTEVSLLQQELQQSEQKRSLLENNLDGLLEQLHKAESERDKWRNEYESVIISGAEPNADGSAPNDSAPNSESESCMADIIQENHLFKRTLDKIANEIKSQPIQLDDVIAPEDPSSDDVPWKDKYENLYNSIDEQLKSCSALTPIFSLLPSDNYKETMNKLQVYQDLYQTSNAEGSDSDQIVSDLHKQIRKLEEENTSLKIAAESQLSSARNMRNGEIHDESAQISKLKEEKENWERRYEILQLDFVSATESYEREVTRISNEIQEVESKNIHCSKEVERLNGLLSVFEKEDDAMNQQLSRSSQESLNLKDVNTALKEKVKALTEQVQKQEETASRLRDVAENERRSLLDKVKKTESQMFRLHEEHEFQAAALRTETEEKHKTSLMLQEEIVRLKDRNADLLSQIEIYKQATREKDQEISQLNKENRVLSTKHQNATEEFKKRVHDLKTRMRGSHSTNDELQSEIELWRQKYESKELEFIEFQASHDVDVEQLMSLSRASQVKIYESEKELETIKSHLEMSQQEEQIAREENLERKCKIDNLVLENTSLKNHSNQLKRELDEHKLRLQYSLRYFPRGNACNIL